jgi:hypothetical protein
MFQIASGIGTTSWNDDNAYYLQVDSWDARPWDPKGPPYQVAGKASGKIIVVFKGSGKHKDSGLAGVFTDAIVRYMGKPAF